MALTISCRIYTTPVDSTENPAVRFAENGDKTELILSPLDAIEETPSLIALRQRVADMLPRVDLPELLLEIDARTHFTGAFTHSSEQSSRVSDLNISICAMLMAEACNTGPEPFIRNDVAALKRDRLTWTDSNYIRDETIRAANCQYRLNSDPPCQSKTDPPPLSYSGTATLVFFWS